ncbi:protein of unknown function (DUF4389) [Mariprofundus aestuarium]|uniref:DUF4389 domain-containing protein n=1 Tax=Mariprofundus aestuarium TaxID=1921086 RepID=A0A2K8KZ99_MARES|nr:DUF4389 domain-containing protein [Mariprofundus aestuarium]ATX80350.1 protein of unknown function (DUF4389) [Mariprofundus aestuarium]
MSDDLKENVMDTNIWIRLVFMLLFAVIFAATRVILVAVIAIQFLWVLFTSNKNEQLLSFGSQLATFLYQIYRYLSFNTEKRPFPFDEFPSSAALLDDAVAEDEAPAPEETSVQPTEKVEPEVAAESPASQSEERKEPEIAMPAEDAPEADEPVDTASESGIESEVKKD